jgi:hypothetical protein
MKGVESNTLKHEVLVTSTLSIAANETCNLCTRLQHLHSAAVFALSMIHCFSTATNKILVVINILTSGVI